MHPDNKHTDKKLQELENQSLPDLSKMDEHWRQMKSMLQSGESPSKVSRAFTKNYLWWIAAAIFISGVALVAHKLTQPTKPGDPTETRLVQQPTGNTTATTDTTPAVPATNANDHNLTITKKLIIPGSGQSLQRKTETGSDTLVPLNSVSDDTYADPKASLAAFFQQLEKQSQVFVINSKRDTLLSGNDGTVLLIPANTFAGKDEVVITLKEYYSYEDIITNQLSTCSDGKQLITGGMIHILATVQGKEVNIQPGKSIRWFIPDTTNMMSQMQLFTGAPAKNNQPTLSETVFVDNNRDTSAGLGRFDGMNWIPQDELFTNTYLVTKFKILNLKNEPFKRRQTKKGEIGFFCIANKPKISVTELEEELKKKYGYYQVKIRKRKKNNFFRKITPSFFKSRSLQTAEALGDSAWIPKQIAQQYQLEATDTFTYMQSDINYRRTPTVFQKMDLNSLAERFSVDIRTLGWINCDRFYNDPRPKIPYYVDLNDTASNYYTLLVFDRIKSMMTGYMQGSRVVFANVPEGESARVISVGIQKGKTVAAMETIEISRNILTDLSFAETSPAAFKEEVSDLDKK